MIHTLMLPGVNWLWNAMNGQKIETNQGWNIAIKSHVIEIINNYGQIVSLEADRFLLQEQAHPCVKTVKTIH